MRLEQQNVIVTGASRGIGRVIAQHCASEGARVALAARSKRDLEEIARVIRTAGGHAVALPTDVTDHASVRRLITRVAEQLGPPDLLVNNAGRLGAIGPTWDTDPADWWSDVTVNLRGVYQLCRAVLPGMRERGAGRIINMVGGGTGGPFPFASAYACSKAAVMRFTETLATELTHTESPVRVFALSPGFVRTAMTEQFTQTKPGRAWMGRLSERLNAGEDNSPELAAEMVVTLGTGALDKLHGRYLHSARDAERLAELTEHASEIAEQDIRTLRLQH